MIERILATGHELAKIISAIPPEERQHALNVAQAVLGAMEQPATQPPAPQPTEGAHA